jgi:hypothetical protein
MPEDETDTMGGATGAIGTERLGLARLAEIGRNRGANGPSRSHLEKTPIKSNAVQKREQVDRCACSASSGIVQTNLLLKKDFIAGQRKGTAATKSLS